MITNQENKMSMTNTEKLASAIALKAIANPLASPFNAGRALGGAIRSRFASSTGAGNTNTPTSVHPGASQQLPPTTEAPNKQNRTGGTPSVMQTVHPGHIQQPAPAQPHQPTFGPGGPYGTGGSPYFKRPDFKKMPGPDYSRYAQAGGRINLPRLAFKNMPGPDYSRYAQAGGRINLPHLDFMNKFKNRGLR